MPSANSFRSRRTTRFRRGTLYVHVLLVSLLVSLLGLAALTNTRIARQIYHGSTDAVQARLYAHAAIRLGMLHIETDPNWRFNNSSGVWKTDVRIGDGTYTLEGIDPTDNNLRNSTEDPLRLVGTGKKNNSIHKVEVTLAPISRGFSALKAALHAGRSIQFNNATVDCDQVISANASVSASSSMVSSDVQAVDGVTGFTYKGAVESGIVARTMPDTTSVFDYYLANGTPIDKSSLPRGNPNMLQNPSMESGINHWYGLDNRCEVSASVDNAYHGVTALRVTERQDSTIGPAQDITGQLVNGRSIYAEVWIHPTVTEDFLLKLRLDTTSGSATIAFTGKVMLTAGQWNLLSGTAPVNWSSTLNRAQWYVHTDSNKNDFDIDAAVCREVGDDRTIARAVLTSSRNPFGATNPEGIYVIQLDGQKIVIRDARIVGTLVLVNPDPASSIGAGTALNWAPAVAGFPALLVKNSNINIEPSNNGLVESQLHTNFNPSGAPYNGVTDNDQLDTYPSQIEGLIYGNQMIYFGNQPVVLGAVVANSDISISGVLNLTHNPTYFRNPPPGFNGPEEIRILLDSAKRPLQ